MTNSVGDTSPPIGSLEIRGRRGAAFISVGDPEKKSQAAKSNAKKRMTAKPTRLRGERAILSRNVGAYVSSSLTSSRDWSLAEGRRKSSAGMAAEY